MDACPVEVEGGYREAGNETAADGVLQRRFQPIGLGDVRPFGRSPVEENDAHEEINTLIVCGNPLFDG